MKRVRESVFSKTQANTNTTNNFTKKKTVPRTTALILKSCAAPNGNKTLTKMAAITMDFKLKPIFNKARDGPEYSVNGPSCNSCSASAKSNGIFPISINIAKKAAIRATSVAMGYCQLCSESCVPITAKLVEPAINAITKNANIKIGSTNTPSVTSRLAPKLENVLFESKPAIEKKKRNSANK